MSRLANALHNTAIDNVAVLRHTPKRLKKSIGIDWDELLKNENNPLLSAIQEWYELLKMTHSMHTVLAYCRALIAFAHFLKENNIKNWQQVNKKWLENYIANRIENGLTNKSAKLTVSAIHQFFILQQNQGKIIKNPADHYRIKVGQKIPNIADVDLIHQLLNQSPPKKPKDHRLWVRDLAMFELLYSSGLRVSELAGLDIGDVDLTDGWVRVLGKGSKWRQVPVGKKARQAIANYLPHRELWLEGDETALFISETLGSRLTTRAIQLRLKVFAKNANIDLDMYPHLLRHCFASHLLSSSGDLRAVQELLGHSNLSTTQIYTQVDFVQLAHIYDKAHPRANLKS